MEAWQGSHSGDTCAKAGRTKARNAMAAHFIRSVIACCRLYRDKLAGMPRDRGQPAFSSCRHREGSQVNRALVLLPRSVQSRYLRARINLYRGAKAESRRDAQDVLRAVPERAGALRLLDQTAPNVKRACVRQRLTAPSGLPAARTKVVTIRNGSPMGLRRFGAHPPLGATSARYRISAGYFACRAVTHHRNLPSR